MMIAPLCVDMEATSTEDRVQWLTEQYDLSTKNAQALILSELGYSHSGIAFALDVSKGTARKYVSNLEEQIGEGVTEALPKDVRYPTFPDGTPKGEVRYSPDKIDYPTCEGEPLGIREIPKDLLTSDHNIEVEQ